MVYVIGKSFKFIRLIGGFKITSEIYYGCNVQFFKSLNILIGRSDYRAAADKSGKEFL